MTVDYAGPYHWARAFGVSRHCDLILAEVASRSREYAWVRSKAEESVCHRVLFEGRSSSEVGFNGTRSATRRFLDEISPNAVFLPGWSSRAALAGLEWCVERQVGAVLMSESSRQDEDRVWWREGIKRWCVRAGAAALVGGRSHSSYLELLGMERDRIFLGYDTVDNGYFTMGVARLRADGGEKLRAELALPSRFFLASARFVDKKNLPRLIEAFGRYRRQAVEHGNSPSTWDLVILGDGPLRNTLEIQVKALGLAGAVKLPGFKQYHELPAYYSLAGAFVHPSTVEQWGLVVNEAMASGLPILVSRTCGCTGELLVDGVNGWAFEPTQVDELATLLRRMADLPEHHRAGMGEASRRIVAGWGIERFAEGFCQAAEMAARRPRLGVSRGTRALLRFLQWVRA
jgi:1,2-diacylglycerol 3-alpha-glucosyltransferase